MKAGLYASFFDHIADTPGEATTLGARAELIEKTEAVITESGWTQAKAAARCGVTQPRFNDLLCAQGSRSPLDALGNIATALGRQVRDKCATRWTRRKSSPATSPPAASLQSNTN